uniref:Uncharacterized protein n=1 Tax=Anguilla anguilla TaxID=7936 RepID=A0A0E9T2E7_ANGAN
MHWCQANTVFVSVSCSVLSDPW